MSEAPPATEGSGASKRKRRVYQACAPCRIRKANIQDDPRPPPCARCKRESIQSECVLASKRNKRDIDSLERFQARENRSSTSADFRREASRVATPGPTASESEDLAASPYPSGTSPNSGQATQFHSPHSTRSNHPSNTEDASSRSYTSNIRRNLTDNVIHTLVSQPNDALALLFDAGRQDPSAINTRNQSPEEELQMQGDFQTYGTNRDAGSNVARLTNTLPTPHSAATSPASTIPDPSSEMIEMWKKYRFVREGWLTAREAIM
ncbi:hypothetical protein DL98DRAFT_577409 [Cadophora sp. DSE1049]|nr:hypothetical protein DL98DRAFT_577409 [Cadophora sp. DSE1049]